MTNALAGLRDVLHVVRSVDSDVSDEAVELRRDIGMLLLAQGRIAEARSILGSLYEDLCVVHSLDHELTVEVAEIRAVIRLDLDGLDPST